MHLRIQLVEHAHAVPRFEQVVRQMRSDEARTAGYENRFPHAYSSRSSVETEVLGLERSVRMGFPIPRLKMKT